LGSEAPGPLLKDAALLPVGGADGTLSEATRGFVGAPPPGLPTSASRRCWIAVCCTLAASCLAWVRAVLSRATVCCPRDAATVFVDASTGALYTFLTFVTFVTLVTLLTMVVCCTSVRGGTGARPALRATVSSIWTSSQRGLSRRCQLS